MAQQSISTVGSSSAPTKKYPLVKAMGLQELLRVEAERAPQAQSIDDQGSLSALASHVRGAWGRNKLAKEKIDLKMLQCLRTRRGVYSPGELAALQSGNSGLNIVFADLTETKCRAASAWIREIILPVGERPWGVDPSPVTSLPRYMQEQVVEKAIAQAQQVMQQAHAAGGAPMSEQEFGALARQLGEKLRDETEAALKKVAKTRAVRMETQIAERLVEGSYEEAMDGFIEDFVTYPAAILKGPIYRRHKQLQWGEGYVPKVSNNPVQSWERVSPFDAYPAPSAKNCQVGDFIERIRFRREELYDLKGLPDYKDDQIDGALRDYTNGHLEGWLWTEAERQRLEQESMYMWLSPPGVIDALNYWGSVPGWKLMSWGVENIKAGNAKAEAIEPTREYECNVLICGAYILYAAVNPDPLDQRPYRKACYDEVPGAFWGRSIPDLAATSQKMCNGIACALADNLSMASGPMVWVHADRFADGEDTQSIYPWRLWQLKSDPSQGVNPGIGFFQADDRAQSLMSTYEQWETRADDATGIPRYTYGNDATGGAGETASGLSMLMNNAAKGLRRAIGNIDLNVIAPSIGQTFTNEMLYNPDHSIKGDCIVVPRGAAAILIKESAQQKRTQFLQMVTNNQSIAQILGPKYIANIVREVASVMEMPVGECVPSEDEVDQKMQQAQQAQQQQIQQAQQHEKDKMNLQAQLEMSKEQAIGAREASTSHAKIIADVVTKAVTAAMAHHTAMASRPPSKKKVKFNFDQQGNIVGGEVAPEEQAESPPPQ